MYFLVFGELLNHIFRLVKFDRGFLLRGFIVLHELLRLFGLTLFGHFLNLSYLRHLLNHNILFILRDLLFLECLCLLLILHEVSQFLFLFFFFFFLGFSSSSNSCSNFFCFSSFNLYIS